MAVQGICSCGWVCQGCAACRQLLFEVGWTVRLGCVHVPTDLRTADYLGSFGLDD